MIALLAIALLFWLGFDINRRIVGIQKSQNEFASHSKAVSILSSLRGDFEKAKIERQFLENILPQQDKLINFPRELNVLAKQNNLQLAFAFGSQKESEEAIPGYISFNIVVAGLLPNWLKFLDALENSNYLISLDSIHIVSNNKEYQLNINGKVFSQ